MNLHRDSTLLGTYQQRRMHRRWSWWSNLASLAQSSAIRRFSAFLIVVPFLVGLLDIIPGRPFTAPWSWAIGYLAAVFFLVGTVLVGMWCPEIAKRQRTYRDMNREGRTTQYILQEAREVYRHYARSPQRANHFLRGLLGSPEYVTNAADLLKELPDETDDKLRARETVWTLVQKADFRADRIAELFWYIKWFSEATDETKRFCCWILFGAGALSTVAFLVVQVGRIAKHYLCCL